MASVREKIKFERVTKPYRCSIRFTEELTEKMVKFCEKEKLNPTQLITAALESYLGGK